jgi:hypothetical protein
MQRLQSLFHYQFERMRATPQFITSALQLYFTGESFWIAQPVADTKYTSNVRPLLQNAKGLAGKRPNTFITDGAANFHDAANKELFTLKGPRTRHISHFRLQCDHNNNKMECMNGEGGPRP